MQYPESDPRHHTGKVKEELQRLTEHLRSDISKVNDVRARALFEVSAEVLSGLQKAFEDFERKNEEAWK